MYRKSIAKYYQKRQNRNSTIKSSEPVSEGKTIETTTTVEREQSKSFNEKAIQTVRENEEAKRLKIQLEESEKKRIEAERKQAETEAKLQRHLDKEKEVISDVVAEKQNSDSTSASNLEITTGVNKEFKQLTPISEVVFLSLPMNERVFSNASKSSVPIIGQTFYIFSINANEITASFEFWNNPDAIKYAIDKPYSHIEPACDSLNVHNSYANQIVTVEKGQAVLEDNKWIVKTKAKIKYLL